MDQTPNTKPPDVIDQAIVSTGEPTKRPRKPRQRWLVLAHVAVGLSTGMPVAWTGAAFTDRPNVSHLRSTTVHSRCRNGKQQP